MCFKTNFFAHEVWCGPVGLFYKIIKYRLDFYIKCPNLIWLKALVPNTKFVNSHGNGFRIAR